LRVAVENTVWTGPDDFNVFFERLRQVHPKLFDRVGMCFDLGHANVCSQTRNDYLGFMDQLSPVVPIIHTHLHENHGDRDSHLPLFTGPSMLNPAGVAGFLERLRARNFDGCGILEQWPQPAQLLVEARDRLNELVGGAG
jgi:sugar phosphate isomerase/epimerase